MTTNKQTRQILERTLRDADVRLSELETLEHTVAPGSYQAQEVLAERAELRRWRDLNHRKLRALNSSPADPDAARRANIELAIQERRETALKFIAALEREGDHQQARLWRMSLLDIPAQVARDFA
jgi:hypothetical protein